jgi:hypothetical protein
VYFNHELYIADGKAVGKETGAFEPLQQQALCASFIPVARVMQR